MWALAFLFIGGRTFYIWKKKSLFFHLKQQKANCFLSTKKWIFSFFLVISEKKLRVAFLFLTSRDSKIINVFVVYHSMHRNSTPQNRGRKWLHRSRLAVADLPPVPGIYRRVRTHLWGLSHLRKLRPYCCPLRLPWVSMRNRLKRQLLIEKLRVRNLRAFLPFLFE